MKIHNWNSLFCRRDLRSTSVGLRIILDISFPPTPYIQCIRKSCRLYLKYISHLASHPSSTTSGQSQHESSSGFPVPSLFLSLQCLLLCSLAEALTPSLTSALLAGSSRASFSASGTSIALFLPQGLFHIFSLSLGHTFP